MLCLNWEVDFPFPCWGVVLCMSETDPVAFKPFNHKSGLILLWTSMLAVSQGLTKF